MKKIIIVNNNMKIGGVQKSLYNLLWSIDTENEYDVTLLLFSKTGAYIDKLPQSVKIVESGGPFRYLGKNQAEYKSSLKDSLVRGFLAAISRFLGREYAIKMMLKRQHKLECHYDCAIAFLHNGRKQAFYGGVQDYVINCIDADKKIAFLHCDYNKCGANYPENNSLLEKFDKVAACSDGCRKEFEVSVPKLRDKAVTVRNCHRYDEIASMAEDNAIIYDSSTLNIVVVARLSHEKGIDRAINAVKYAVENGIELKLHVVGGGSMSAELQELAGDISEHVVFYGEQSNPYKYMKNADLLLLTSYHEAAPMVIDETRSLGVPILSTKTTSSQEMIVEARCGWVCENNQQSLNETLGEVLRDIDKLRAMKNKLLASRADNNIALRQFENLFNG